MSNHRWPTALAGRIAFGGDYNPEQWPRATWHEDIELMREAGVTFATIALWSWASLEPRPGEYDFADLDETLNLLHEAGIAVDLGTPTAAPPAWLYAAHPEARVLTSDGVPLGPGSRGMLSPSSPAYRAAAAGIAGALAQRYADHPAVVMWHVHNEYGAPISQDFSEPSIAAFRSWLRQRYGSLEALNLAWGTAFWGQTYTSWEHLGAPVPTASTGNQAQALDWLRFADHQLRECFLAERDAIRRFSDKPVTTNFMANQCPSVDMFAWADAVDLVSNDHYLTAADEHGHIGLSLAADLTRSVAGGRPWILMEHSTSAVNWQPRNLAKRPGEMARNSLAHVARGADVVGFFQWRASRVGAEKFHLAMLPHAGSGSRVFREVCALGQTLGRLGEVQGSDVRAEVAIVWDTVSHWAQQLPWRPSVDIDPLERTRAYYERLWNDGVTADFVRPTDDLSAYRLVVVPASYLLTATAADNLTGYVRAGGTLLVSYFSAVVDENDAVHPGGYLAPLAEVLGVGVAEFLPLREGEQATVTWNHPAGRPRRLTTQFWQEDLAVTGAQVVATNDGGPASGQAAITRNTYGNGTAWYVSTHLDVDGLAPVLAAAYTDAGITTPHWPEGVEVVVRHGDQARYLFALNHADSDADLPLPSGAVDLLTGVPLEGTLHLPAAGFAVVLLPLEAD